MWRMMYPAAGGGKGVVVFTLPACPGKLEIGLCAGASAFRRESRDPYHLPVAMFGMRAYGGAQVGGKHGFQLTGPTILTSSSI